MAFEVDWNEAKRLSNIEERGVDFRDAALIFEGPVLEKEDTRDDYGEQRFGLWDALTTNITLSPIRGADRLAGSSALGK